MNPLFLSVSLLFTLQVTAQKSKSCSVDQEIKDFFIYNYEYHFDDLYGIQLVSAECMTAGKKEMNLVLYSGYVRGDITDSMTRSCLHTLAYDIYNHVLIHHPEYDGITISLLQSGTSKNESISYYLLDKKVFYCDNASGIRFNLSELNNKNITAKTIKRYLNLAK